jgi:fermentation-respiration switch protein FrsA (DUF1100 family)
MMRLLIIAVALYVAYSATGFLFQRRMLFPGVHLQPFREVDADTLPGVERIWFENGPGHSEAWFLPGPAPGIGPVGPTIIFQHGNAEYIDDWVSLLPAFSDLGVGVLLLEYPGYGRSTGAPSEANIVTAAAAAFDWLQAKEGVDPDRIVGLGRSLGGGATLALARKRPLAAVIVQSTFTSVGAMALSSYLMPPFLARDPFDNVGAIRGYPGPSLVLHGENDEIIPFRHGAALVEASEGRARLIPLPCGHNDCPPSWSEFWRTVAGFLEENGLLEPLQGEGQEPG